MHALKVAGDGFMDSPVSLSPRAVIRKDADMLDQGRLLRVVFVLMAALTVGAMVLLALEGKPIKPTAFSLAGEPQLNPVHTALATQAGIKPGRWHCFEVLYERHDSPAVAMSYHFVIGNGENKQDGQIYSTHHWDKQLACSNTPDAEHTIRICLISKSAEPGSTPRQKRRLNALVKYLVEQCQIEPKINRKDQ